MKFSFLALALGLLLSSLSFARGGGDSVNNGAGLSEQNIVYASANLGELLRHCRTSPACGLSDSEKASLNSVLAAFLSRKPELRFLRESDLGGDLFRVEKSLWLINTDRLWKDTDRSVPYGLADAVLLVLRMADDSSQLLSSALLKKISDHFSRSVIEKSFMTDDQEELHFLYWDDRAELVLRLESGKQWNLSETLFAAVRGCAQNGITEGRILDPVAVGREKQERGQVFHFLFKLQFTCGDAGSSADMHLSLLLPKDSEKELEILDVTEIL